MGLFRICLICKPLNFRDFQAYKLRLYRLETPSPKPANSQKAVFSLQVCSKCNNYVK